MRSWGPYPYPSASPGASEHLVTKYDPHTSFVLEIALLRVAGAAVEEGGVHGDFGPVTGPKPEIPPCVKAGGMVPGSTPTHPSKPLAPPLPKKTYKL